MTKTAKSAGGQHRSRTIGDAVREICLSFPEAEEILSHGSPNFRVRGKTFATYAVNHHGDGRVAFWLNAPQGAQALHTVDEPKHFFVPPYVGPRGWLGVRLDTGLGWKRIAALVRSAYERVAPPALSARIDKTIEIDPPPRKLAASELDPLQSPEAKRILRKFADLCLGLPETTEAKQFGSPVWRAGKKTFASAYDYGEGLKLAFWVGAHRQGFLTMDERFSIPAYLGHIGWIALDVSGHCDWHEIRELTLESYRHFALKRMLSRIA